MSVNAEFLKFPGDGEEKRETVTLRFGDVIICLIMSNLRKVHKQVAYQLLIGGGKIPGYFCLIS